MSEPRLLKMQPCEACHKVLITDEVRDRVGNRRGRYCHNCGAARAYIDQMLLVPLRCEGKAGACSQGVLYEVHVAGMEHVHLCAGCGSSLKSAQAHRLRSQRGQKLKVTKTQVAVVRATPALLEHVADTHARGLAKLEHERRTRLELPGSDHME